MPNRRAALWIPLSLAFTAFLIYAPAERFDFVNYDDPVYVANTHIRGGLTAVNLKWAFISTSDGNWFPLTRISHLADHELFGEQPGPDHLMNAALHAIGALLLFAAFRKLTGSVWRSAFVAMVFALHPLHVESVAWIAERKDVLSGVFFFAAIWSNANYAARPSAGRYAVVALLTACALMSKPTTVTLPVVFVLLDFWPLKRGWKLLEKIPLLAMAAGVSLVTYFAQRSAGAVFQAGQIPLAMRIENATVSYGIYILKFFVPSGLAVFYPYPTAIPIWQTGAVAALLIAISAAVWMSRRGSLIVGWLWFLITLLPMIGLIQAGVQARADRYTYLPLTGLAIMMGWFAAEFFKSKRGLTIAGASAAAAMAIVTSVNLQNWRDSVSLFRHAIAVTEGNYVAYNNLGAAIRARGDIAQAIPLFETAIRLNPLPAEAQDNLGEALLAQKKPDQAAPHIAEALRLNPHLATAHVNLAMLLNQQGRFAEAVEQDRIALRLDPENVDAHAALGISLTELGRYDQALPELLEALSAQPRSADLHYNLGRLYGLAGRPADAIAEFEEAIRLDPSDAAAYFNLGTALAAQNQWSRAEEQFRTAARLDPNDRRAHFNLASALANEGRYADAIPEFTEVLRIDPNFTDARRALEYCRKATKQR